MRIAALVVVVASLLAVPPIAFSACGGSPSAPDAGGSTRPTQDGTVCGCATPDCLPSCADLPACKLVCTAEGTREWVDPCGVVSYAQACASGCVDAAVDAGCD
jgi:hypothetical protein